MNVRDHLPLQQGLRLNFYFAHSVRYIVRDHLPLQQGLRQVYLQLVRMSLYSTRPSSTTTRIKTQR